MSRSHTNSRRAAWARSEEKADGDHAEAWCGQVMRSRIEPMKKVARTLRAHRKLI